MSLHSEIQLASLKGSDQLVKLRSADPVKYGEELVRMNISGKTQKEIADILSCNRQMVGRYQRIGRWPDEVKKLINSNREKISNTNLLILASSQLTDSELFKKVTDLINSAEESIESNGSLLASDTSSLRAVHKPDKDSLASIENPIVNTLQSLDSKQDMMSNVFPKVLEVTWNSLFQAASNPVSVLLLICIIFFTSYLIYQGGVFFSGIDNVPLSAWTSALVSESIPFLSAFCFALASKKLFRIFSFIILVTSIIGLGIFMHSSIEGNAKKSSNQHERLNSKRDLTDLAIKTHLAILNSVSESHVTKRQVILDKIYAERSSLSEIDEKIEELEKNRDLSNGKNIFYSTWIRVGAMLLNIVLIHLFVTVLKDNIYFLNRPLI